MAVRGRKIFEKMHRKISDARAILVLLLATALLSEIFLSHSFAAINKSRRTFKHPSQKIAGRRAVASSRTRSVLASLKIRHIFRRPPGLRLQSPWSRLQGKAATFVLSHAAQEKGVPGARSALRVDQRRLSSTLSTGAFIQRTVFKLSFLLFQCLFVFPAADSV